MNRRNFIKRAYDSFDSNAFITSDTYATAVNPKVWDEQLREYQKKVLVYATTGVQEFDFRKPGRDYTVTVDAAPTAAAALAETAAVSIQPLTNRQVTFTPAEYGTGFEVSKSELEDAFFAE